jgi:signal transduction histidine kinase
LAVGLSAGAIAIAAIAWALRTITLSRNASAEWSDKLATMEARLEKSEAVLSAHPGLVLVWEDDYEDIENGWGRPKVLGGPAGLASLMSFAREATSAIATPADRLLETLGDLPLEDDGELSASTRLREKVGDLRRHGVAFSGVVYTSQGRAIEVDGRVAGDQVALWLTDPAVRMAEDGGIMGRVREKSADLHSALAQMERAPMPAWRRDSDLRLAWVNAAYVEAVEAESVMAALREQREIDSAARRIAEKATTDRRTADGKVAVNVKGQRRVFRLTEMPMHSAGDAATFGFAVDVTELERARADLAQHVESNRRTLDQIPTAVALFGANQELTYYNAAFSALWGFEEAELSARPGHGELLDRLRQKSRLPEQADYGAWKQRQLSLYMETMAAPGVERHGAAPDEVWHLPGGKMLRVARARHPLGGVIVIFDDITEKLRLEASYNTQIKVQRATLNNLSEGVATFGADGRLRLYNAAFERIWQFGRSDLADSPHVENIFARMIERVVSGGEAVARLRQRITSMSPEDRQPVADAMLSLTDGRTLGLGSEPLPDGATLVRFLDVTDSKEREKELKERNDLLEEIDRQKSRFVDHVSYQLRTPLNTIIGFTEMIDGQMFGVLNDRQKDYVASILQASYTLKDLISDIMDLAALDAGKLGLEREEVSLKELLTNAAAYSALKAEDTQVQLKTEVQKEIGVLNADARRLKQVLFNLLSNAFTHTASGGHVTLGADRSPGLVRIWVEDSGRGVSPEDQAKAFDPFVASGPSAGAGLGLSLVQRLINLHGGYVRMESAPGEGTRVTCFLPTAPTEASDFAEAATAIEPDQAAAVSAASIPSPAATEKSGGNSRSGVKRANSASSKRGSTRKPAQRAEAAE